MRRSPNSAVGESAAGIAEAVTGGAHVPSAGGGEETTGRGGSCRAGGPAHATKATIIVAAKASPLARMAVLYNNRSRYHGARAALPQDRGRRARARSRRGRAPHRMVLTEQAYAP